MVSREIFLRGRSPRIPSDSGKRSSETFVISPTLLNARGADAGPRSAAPARTQLTCLGGDIDYMVIAGPENVTPMMIISMTGVALRGPMPPDPTDGGFAFLSPIQAQKLTVP